MSVSVNRPFQAVVGECWEKYLLDVVNGLDSINDLSALNFKLAPPTRQHIVDWVLEGYNYLLLKSTMIQKSFEVCGITTTDPERVRSDRFYKSIMEKVREDIQKFDEFVDDDPFDFEPNFSFAI